MSFMPKPQEIYQHFKGKTYQIITLAEHTETGETFVIYQALYGDYKIYARELGNFTSKVDREKYPNAAQGYRFELKRFDVAGETKAEETPATPAERTVASAENVVTPAAEPTEKAEAYVERPATTVAPMAQPEESPVAPASQPATQEEEVPDLDPLLLEFLDAKDYETKLSILVAAHHRITQDMITVMAVSCDVEVEDGELEERYAQLKNCLTMLEKYECNRLR